MLSYLRVRGLALIDDLTLELSSGLNVLTGETGAGKSLLVDALMLLRGARAKTELVRAGEEAASVEAQFELAPTVAQSVSSMLVAQEIPAPEEGDLLIRRTVPRAGRGRIFLQDALVPQAVLASVAEFLVDICSQHEHHSLTQVSQHLVLLDTYADHADALTEYAQRWRRLRQAHADLEELRSRSGGAEQRMDYLRFQLEELERLSPKPGEDEELRQKIALMRASKQWADFVAQLQEVLDEAEPSIIGRLGWFAERASTGAEQSPHLSSIAESLRTARAACDEALVSAQRFADGIDLDPDHLEQAEERLHELLTLKRKHGVPLEELAERLTHLRTELEELEGIEDRIAHLGAEVQRLRAEAMEQAHTLHTQRAAASERLSKALLTELSALHLPKARLSAEVTQLGDEELGPSGLDQVEFRFSANVGEPLAPLNRVASGGELSRVLLALKGVLAEEDRVATYVFDEVDAGVGGAVAEAIGVRLSRAAAEHQVLCITHLPQIAAFADCHFRVEKLTQAGRTVTRVRKLEHAERVEELARMLGGARITDTARQHAEQLIAEATRARKDASPKPRRRAAPRR